MHTKFASYILSTSIRLSTTFPQISFQLILSQRFSPADFLLQMSTILLQFLIFRFKFSSYKNAAIFRTRFSLFELVKVWLFNFKAVHFGRTQHNNMNIFTVNHEHFITAVLGRRSWVPYNLTTLEFNNIMKFNIFTVRVHTTLNRAPFPHKRYNNRSCFLKVERSVPCAD